MIPLDSPFRLFADAYGKPLDGGYVYFGQAGQNPETSPVTVYWDAAGTIPAAQPLRTSAGYIVRNGAPANVYYTGSYSETVRDANSVLVFTDSNRTTNPQNYLTSITAAQITSALGYTPANITAPTLSGRTQLKHDNGASFDLTDMNVPTVVNSGGQDAAIMQFGRQGYYGLKFGLDYNNNFALGGYSMGTNVFRWTSDPSGNFTALGNVTAYSDIKFKEEIEQIRSSVQRTLMMRGVTYLDNRTGQRKIGGIAQDALRAGFSEAVCADAHGLSLAYGQLALALVIENTRELQAQIDQLKRPGKWHRIRCAAYRLRKAIFPTKGQ